MSDATTLQESLDRFEKVLEDGLVKICKTAGLLDDIITSPDIDGKWDEFIKDYVADAVENVQDYPEAAIGFAAFLGMAVANHWDRDWEGHRQDRYVDYYGPNGFDDMDDSIMANIICIQTLQERKVVETLKSCAQAALALMAHEQIDLGTEYGFYALARCYCVMYRIGESVELHRLGYSKQYLN